MSDFSALIASVESYIKQNGNNEITGNILQEVLVGIINTLGTQAINALETGLSTEQTTRANADTALGGRIDTEEGARQQADNALQMAINSINTKLAEGAVYKGIATPSTTPPAVTGKVFYVAVQGGTYIDFGNLAVTQGLNIIYNSGSSWYVTNIIKILDDVRPTDKNLVDSDAVSKEAILSRAMYPDRPFVDANHLMNYPTGYEPVPSYEYANTFNCVWLPIKHGASYITIRYDGEIVTPLISFWSSTWYDNDYFISRANSGNIPATAKLAVINFAKTSYPDPSLITIEQDGKMFPIEYEVRNRELCQLPARGVFVDYGYVASITSGVVTYYAHNLWDCVWIPITVDASYVKASYAGLSPTATYRFFSSMTKPSTENYLGNNYDGRIPAGAKLCIINQRKADLTAAGYDDIHVEFVAGKRKTVRLLSIGNSYSDDALSYVPFILQNMGAEVDIQIGILMQSSASMDTHVSNWENETAAYSFRLYDGGSSWKQLSGTNSIQWALDNYTWDIITMQQSSQGAYMWATYQPAVNKLANYIGAYVDYAVKFVWYQPQARPAQTNSGANWPDETITEHYEGTALASEKILNETVCEFVVPVGTAIQNARTIAPLKAMGAYADNTQNTSGLGYLTPNDGVHLQEGLPCQIAAYTFVLALLKLYGMEYMSIIGETTRATAEWAADKNIPSPHGDYVGATDANCLIGQQCAIMAMRHPFEVTDMSYIVNPT